MIKLTKALYGLVEAGRLWYEKLVETLERMHFRRMTGDPCMFVLTSYKRKRKFRKAHLTVIGVLVDDFILIGTRPETIDRVKRRLGQLFKSKDLGIANWILGMRIQQFKDRISLDQAQHIADVLDRFNQFGISGANQRASTPLPVKKQFERRRCDELNVDKPYRELVGCLAYLSTGTRPDITYAVSHLSRFLNEPTEAHWSGAIHVLQYLNGTRDLAVQFTKANVPASES